LLRWLLHTRSGKTAERISGLPVATRGAYWRTRDGSCSKVHADIFDDSGGW